MDREHPFTRYLKIDHLLQLRKPYAVSRVDLQNRCNVAERTIKKDISYMRDIMNAPIKYSRLDKGYIYTENYDISKHLAIPKKEIEQLQLGISILEKIKDNGILEKILTVYQKLDNQQFTPYSKYVLFEEVPYYSGSELISFILEAIEKKYPIHINYQSFHSDSKVNRIIYPYLLKEHNNRWFVISHLPQFNSYATYALDRIDKISIKMLTNQNFQIPKDFNHEAYFKYTYGITVLHAIPEKIILSFTKTQSKYFISKPFFPYTIIKKNDQELIVEMELKPNYEFIRKLASLGSGVKILQPNYLQQQLVEYLRKAIEQY